MERAEVLISLCRFFHKLPSEILDEDVELMQLMTLYHLGNPGGVGPDG